LVVLGEVGHFGNLVFGPMVLLGMLGFRSFLEGA
jgi:hypothetical protein